MELQLRSHAVRRAQFSIIALAAVLGVAHAQTYTYTTIDGPSNPGLVGTVVSSINNSGETAGYYVDLTPFGPAYSAFMGNANGTSFTTLSRPGTIGLGGSGIDSYGDIVGVSVDINDVATGFLRDPAGNYTTIDPSTGGLTSGYSEAVGINDSGVIVGFYAEQAPTNADPYPPEHAFIDNHGVFTSVDYPGGFNTELDTINNAGVMTGEYFDALGNQESFIDNGGVFQQITLPGFTQTTVSSVNMSGNYVAVGLVPDMYNVTGDDATSFVYSGGTYHPFGVPGAISTEAYTLNDVGQISGYYIDSHEVVHGFVATPTAVPEPTSIVGLGCLAGGVIVRRRRNRPTPKSI